MKYKIYNQDVREWAKEYSKGKFHALLCDPPYHLTSIVKRFGKKNSAPAQYGTDGVFSRASKGFMGQEWDGGDIAFDPETWSALGEHLYPGAFGMAFSASRNWHKLAVAIEGFLLVHPSEMIRHADLLAHARDKKDWNLVELVEKWMREQVSIQESLRDAGFVIHPTIFLWAQGQGFPKATNISKQMEKGKVIGQQKITGQALGKTKGFKGTNPNEQEYKTEWDLVEFESDIGKAWQGHRYGLQALKPAVEPIIVFQKPYDGRPLDNIVETGAGALNIDASRIPTQDEYVINRFTDGAKPFGNGAGHEYESVKAGRPLRTRKKTDASGKGTIFGEAMEGSEAVGTTTQGRWPANLILDGSAERLDAQTDGTSRFFYNVSTKLDENDPVYYCGKVSPKERNAGLDEKNNHPTLKPIDLSRYLATLLLPPEAYTPRRILIPFSGVASEMIGAALAGWEQIVGVEFDTENGYVDIAHKRMEYWTNK